MAKNLVDNLVSYGVDRIAHARQAWESAFKTTERSHLPDYLVGGGGLSANYLETLTEDEKRRIALTISWVFADIKLIANEASSMGMRVKRLVDERLEEIKNHPFEMILNHPNSEMDITFLLQYTIYWMSLRGKAYWFLAPERGDPNVIKEIWPIQADRLTPVPGKDVFVEKYLYRTNRGGILSIDPHYVVFLRYPNPFNLWDGLSPLTGASLPMETEIGSAKWQRDTYTTGRGIPHSVISLDKGLGDRDFLSASQRIREDFEEERKVAITRAGEMDVKTVGISPRELELIKSRQFTRDEIDSVFLGVPLRDHSSDTWLAGADKVIKEKIIWPLHKLMAGQISVQAVQRFYEEDVYLEFDDIRPQDRSVSVQEANIYWRVHTFNEAREALGKPKYENKAFESFGDLPVPLAIDPAFVTLFYDIGRLDPLTSGNLPGSADNLDRLIGRFNDIAQRRTVTPQTPQPGYYSAESPIHQVNRLAQKAELQRWKRVALKELANGKNPGERVFLSEVLNPDESIEIQSALNLCKNAEEIKALFMEKVGEWDANLDSDQK